VFDSIVANVLELKTEQRVSNEFPDKLNTTAAAESYRMLGDVYGEECLSRARVFQMA